MSCSIGLSSSVQENLTITKVCTYHELLCCPELCCPELQCTEKFIHYYSVYDMSYVVLSSSVQEKLTITTVCRVMNCCVVLSSHVQEKFKTRHIRHTVVVVVLS